MPGHLEWCCSRGITAPSAALFALIAFLVFAIGCIDSKAHFCAEGLVCPTSMRCDESHGICVLPVQIDACKGKDDGRPCTFPGAPSGSLRCDEGVCLLGKQCGNGSIDPPEECDLGNLGGATCVDFGYSAAAGLGCNIDCRFDASACRSTCGDGHLEPREDCDDGNRVNHDGCDQACAIEACVVFVDASADATGADGRHWWSAWPDLAAALRDPRAQQESCEIWAAGGRYQIYKTSRQADCLRLPQNVRIFGGFAGYEYLRAQRDIDSFPTILDGRVPGDAQRGVYHVLVGAARARLDGLIITGGTADATGPGGSNVLGGGLLVPTDATGMHLHRCTFRDNTAVHGGGIANLAVDLRIEACTFAQNRATHDDAALAQTSRGGAVLNRGSSSLVIASSTFVENHAGSGGAIATDDDAMLNVQGAIFERNQALYLGGALLADAPVTVRSSTFLENGAYSGGAALNTTHAVAPEFSDCWFQGNWADLYGAAVHSVGCAPSFQRNHFVENSPAYLGGALYFRDSVATVRNSEFVGNRGDRGGALYCDSAVLEVSNTCFDDNWAAQYGAVIYSARTSTLEITNCTIVRSQVGGTGSVLYLSGESDAQMTNSIVALNSLPVFHSLGNLVDVRYSLVQGNYPGVQVLDATPVFEDLVSGDLRLAAGSPGIDAGEGNLAPTLDRLGATRCDDLTVTNTGHGNPDYTDLGAHERRAGCAR